MIIRTSALSPSRPSRRESRFLDDLLLAALALGVAVTALVVVMASGRF